jgi:ATP-binding cassette, subfamily B, bacterial
LAGLLSGFSISAIYFYIVWLCIQKQLNIGDFVLYSGAALILQSNLFSIGFGIGFLPTILSYLPSLDRVIREMSDSSHYEGIRQIPCSIKEGIVFKNVTFSYPSHDTQILNDVSFEIKPGECLALVGKNGVGKTTIVKLILRLYEPTSGEIFLDGVNLCEYDIESLRRSISSFFQDYVHYELTILENIALGSLDKISNRELILETAKWAGADGFISNFSSGLETQIGKEFSTNELSHGEWQKLALARTIIRDSQILILDEPTSSIDVETEYQFYKRFHELTRYRMTLLISHRLSAVQMADRILYLEDGEILEQGSHNELIEMNGEYAHLYSLQASQYFQSDSVEAV